MDTEEDNRIMLAVKAGDLDGIGILFEKYQMALVGFFRRMSGQSQQCEDLVQEVFWRILKYRESFDTSRPFRAWMYRIARNVMYDQSKKNVAAGNVFDDRQEVESEAVSEPASGVENEVEKSEHKQLLRKALSKLPTEKRELIVLCRYEEIPYQEIADMYDCSVGALKVRLFRALQELKAVFIEIAGEKVL